MKLQKQSSCLLGTLLAAMVLCGLGQAAEVRAQSHGTQATRALVEQMVKDDEQAKECLASEYHGDATAFGEELDIKRLSLNRNVSPEIIIQLGDACPGGANSPIFVYRRTPKGYDLLLKDSGTDITARRSRTNGWRDVVIVAHSSATDHVVTIYKYHGGKYEVSRRFDTTR